MTPPADRLPRTSPEHFEEIARIHAREEEGAWLELIGGTVRPKARMDGGRGLAVEWLTRGALAQRPELWFHPGQGITGGRCRDDRLRVDGVLAPSEAFVGQGEWADPAPVLMAVEVTSYEPETDRCARAVKPAVYAATGIPVSLLIDREAGELVVRSRPQRAGYAERRTVPFGARLRLPPPVGLELDSRRLRAAAPSPRECPPRPRAAGYPGISDGP
ncbi:Uma2 family endonuclease [Streptomyces sp. NPDC057743]|uniref:Uma2 family endonuclease n=1 Tax=Streptomyces sp. NPDC057743 TaxID=3346236 RepID=UPI003694746A